MNFYQPNKQFYCGVDLHARTIYICIIDQKKKVLTHKQLRNNDTELFLKILEPYKDNIVVAAESCFAWYWLADLCADQNIEFILGHALYMKAIHGGKSKNDRIDSYKIALLASNGLFPLAYVYPRTKRSLRDLLRRRLTFVRTRADLLTHMQLTNYQVNNPALGRISKSKTKRDNLIETFEDKTIRASLLVDNSIIEHYDKIISKLEWYLIKNASETNYKEYSILQSIKGVGEIIALTILYEVDDIRRFETVQKFASYCRLVKCTHESAGKRYASKGSKIGNVYLKYIFSEAAVYVVKFNPEIERYFRRLESKKGKGKAYAVIAHKIARAIYYMLKRGKVFDEKKFLARCKSWPGGKSRLITGVKCLT